MLYATACVAVAAAWPFIAWRYFLKGEFRENFVKEATPTRAANTSGGLTT
jgi:hypothetical protein